MSRKRNRSQNKKVRRLRSQVRYYESVLRDARECLLDYEKEWQNDFEKLKAHFSMESSHTEDGDSDGIESRVLTADHILENEINGLVDKNDETVENPDWVRKIFKQIAMISHPDKSSDRDREKLSSIFKRASAALDEKRYDELVGIAIDIDVDIDISDPRIIDIIQSRIESSQMEIRNIENQPSWIWCESIGFADIRADFISQYLSLLGYRIDLCREKIINIISDIENDV